MKINDVQKTFSTFKVPKQFFFEGGGGGIGNIFRIKKEGEEYGKIRIFWQFALDLPKNCFAHPTFCSFLWGRGRSVYT